MKHVYFINDCCVLVHAEITEKKKLIKCQKLFFTKNRVIRVRRFNYRSVDCRNKEIESAFASALGADME